MAFTHTTRVRVPVRENLFSLSFYHHFTHVSPSLHSYPQPRPYIYIHSTPHDSVPHNRSVFVDHSAFHGRTGLHIHVIRWLWSAFHSEFEYLNQMTCSKSLSFLCDRKQGSLGPSKVPYSKQINKSWTR